MANNYQYRAETGVTSVACPCCNRHFPLSFRGRCDCGLAQFIVPPALDRTFMANHPGLQAIWTRGSSPPPPLYYQLGPPMAPPPPYTGQDLLNARAAGARAGVAAALRGDAPGMPLPPPPRGPSPQQTKSEPRRPGPQYQELRDTSYFLVHAIQVPANVSYKILFEGRVQKPSFKSYSIPSWAPTIQVLKTLGADKKDTAITECIEWGGGSWGMGCQVLWGDGKNPPTIAGWQIQTVGARNEQRPEPVWVISHAV